MKLNIGDKVTYHCAENTFPRSINNGKTYTGIVTEVKREVSHDRARIQIDSNPEDLDIIDTNQKFLDLFEEIIQKLPLCLMGILWL